MKKVLIISSTMRKEGNSEVLAKEFARGANSSGNSVEIISLRNKMITFCKGCLSCQKTNKCLINDDANEVISKMLIADVIVFATPIYFYEMSGQLKTLLDRTNVNFNANYLYRNIYLIATAADSSRIALDGAIKGLQGWVDCFQNTKIAGVLHGIGVTEIGEVKSNTSLLKEAFDMGKGV